MKPFYLVEQQHTSRLCDYKYLRYTVQSIHCSQESGWLKQLALVLLEENFEFHSLISYPWEQPSPSGQKELHSTCQVEEYPTKITQTPNKQLATRAYDNAEHIFFLNACWDYDTYLTHRTSLVCLVCTFLSSNLWRWLERMVVYGFKYVFVQLLSLRLLQKSCSDQRTKLLWKLDSLVLEVYLWGIKWHSEKDKCIGKTLYTNTDRSMTHVWSFGGLHRIVIHINNLIEIYSNGCSHLKIQNIAKTSTSKLQTWKLIEMS